MWAHWTSGSIPNFKLCRMRTCRRGDPGSGQKELERLQNPARSQAGSIFQSFGKHFTIWACSWPSQDHGPTPYRLRCRMEKDTSCPGFPFVEVEATPVFLMLSLLVLSVRVEGCWGQQLKGQCWNNQGCEKREEGKPSRCSGETEGKGPIFSV